MNDRRENFKCSKSSSSNNLDDENDFDKIFNHYMGKTMPTESENEQTALNQLSQQITNKHRGLFSFFFRPHKGVGHHHRSRTIDSSFKSKFKFFSRRNKKSKCESEQVSSTAVNDDDGDEIEEGGPDHLEIMNNLQNGNKKSSLNSNFKFDLRNLNFNQIEKDFLKNNKRQNGQKSDSIMSSDSIYLDAGLIASNRIKKSKSTSQNVVTGDQHINNNFGHSFFKSNNTKALLNAFVDVSIERLQQHLDGHLLAMSIKNLRFEQICYHSLEIL